MKKYIVPIIYRGLNNYVVEAPNPEEAVKLATIMYQDDEPPTPCSHDWEEIDHIGEVEELKPHDPTQVR